MSRARRARRIAAAAAFGGGGLGVLGAAGYGLLAVEAKLARKVIGQPWGDGPRSSEVHGDRVDGGLPIRLAMLGDSTAVGLGAGPEHTPGTVLATALADVTGRQVRLRVAATVGARSADLPGQVDHLLTGSAAPDVAVIMVGANDVTHRVKPAVAVRALEAVVRALVEAGSEVIVGTCPDLGTIEPIAPPLRHLARRWSRRLAAAQTIAVVEAGGISVSLGDLLGPEFAARPGEMFSSDRFHPSAAGYDRVAGALLPSVAAAVGHDVRGAQPRGRSTSWHPEGIADIAHVAARAAAVPGSEVSGIEVGGAARGPHGRWAVLRRPGRHVAGGLRVVRARLGRAGPDVGPQAASHWAPREPIAEVTGNGGASPAGRAQPASPPHPP